MKKEDEVIHQGIGTEKKSQLNAIKEDIHRIFESTRILISEEIPTSFETEKCRFCIENMPHDQGCKSFLNCGKHFVFSTFVLLVIGIKIIGRPAIEFDKIFDKISAEILEAKSASDLKRITNEIEEITMELEEV